jgi:diaminopimelate decarboxylase
MASNYNMVARPPLVAVADGRVRELIRRETISDLLSRDRGWASEQTPRRNGAA